MVTDTGSLDPLLLGLALRADNPMDSRICRENATVTVSYGGLILGLGQVQDFCVAIPLWRSLVTFLACDELSPRASGVRTPRTM